MSFKNKYTFCEKEEIYPFKCNHYGGTFCFDHRLPEMHQYVNMPKKKIAESRINKVTDIPDISKPVISKDIRNTSKPVIVEHKKKGMGKGTTALAALVIILVFSNIFVYISLQSQIANLQLQYNSLTSIYQNYASTHTHTNFEYTQLNSTYQFLESSYSILINEKNVLESQLNSLNTVYQNYVLYHTHTNSEYNQLNSNYLSFQSSYSTLINEKNVLESQLNSLNGQISALNNQISSLETQLNTIKSIGIHNPTYDEMLSFIQLDQTNTNTYNEPSYTCVNYAADVVNHAYSNHIECGFVYLEFTSVSHAIVCFNTVDIGIIYIEPQTDEIVSVYVGSTYFDLGIVTKLVIIW